MDVIRADAMTSAVIHVMVLKAYHAAVAAVAAVLVRVDRLAGGNMLRDGGLERVLVSAIYRLCDGLSATLAHPEHRLLPGRAATRPALLVGVHVPFLPTDVSLVNFDDAAQLPEVLAVRLAESAQHEPCVFWVTPISFESCTDEIPLRAVITRYIA